MLKSLIAALAAVVLSTLGAIAAPGAGLSRAGTSIIEAARAVSPVAEVRHRRYHRHRPYYARRVYYRPRYVAPLYYYRPRVVRYYAPRRFYRPVYSYYRPYRPAYYGYGYGYGRPGFALSFRF